MVLISSGNPPTIWYAMGRNGFDFGGIHHVKVGFIICIRKYRWQYWIWDQCGLQLHVALCCYKARYTYFGGIDDDRYILLLKRHTVIAIKFVFLFLFYFYSVGRAGDNPPTSELGMSFLDPLHGKTYTNYQQKSDWFTIFWIHDYML